MALVLKDRVKVTTTTSGTGALTLGSAATGFQDFSAIGDGNATYYTINDPETGDWEVGIGTYTAAGTSLSRDGVLSSSNAGSLVNFAANVKSVFVTYPAEKSSVSYYTSVTANYTAGFSEGVLADTSGGAFTVTLPASPYEGAQVSVSDSGGLFGTNNLTVARNGSTITGLSEDLVLDINSVTVNFVYDGSTWLVFAQIGGNGGTAVTPDGTQTLTNKTIAFGSNTLTDVASTNTSQTLTNKTISVDDNVVSGLAASSFVLSDASGNIDGTASQKAIPSGAVVGTTDTQTLSGKTITDLVFDGDYTEEVFTADDTVSLEIDPGNGTIQVWTLTANRTLSATNFAAGQTVTMMIADGTAYAITWPSVTWVGGSAPTLATSGYSVVTLWKVGSTLYGASVGDVA